MGNSTVTKSNVHNDLPFYKKPGTAADYLFTICPFLIISIIPELLAWCSERDNVISIADLQTRQDYSSFQGATVTHESIIRP